MKGVNIFPFPKEPLNEMFNHSSPSQSFLGLSDALL